MKNIFSKENINLKCDDRISNIAKPIEHRNRIAGGYPIQNISDAPWQVSIHMNGVFICGGAIISSE